MQPFVLHLLQQLKEDPAWSLPEHISPADLRLSIRRANHKWVLFAWITGSQEPDLVIKVPMQHDDALRIDREYDNLHQLNNSSLPAKGFPHLYARIHTAYGPVLILPFIQHTTPMHIHLSAPWTRYSKKRWRACLNQAADYLLEWQQAGIRPLPEHTLQTYQHKMLTDTFTPICKAIIAGKIPLTLQHGDFNPANILMHRNGLTIVDWEWMQWPGLPLVDLFNLALRAAMLRQQLGHTHSALPSIELVKTTFNTQTPETAFMQYWLPRFQQQLNISDENILALFRCFVSFVVPDRLTSKELDDLSIVMC